MARTYPDTQAGRSRALRDSDDAYMSGKGHRMQWKRWRSMYFRASGWEGVCGRCGDTLYLASLRDGVGYRYYTDADGKEHGFRQCKRGRSC